MGMNYWSFRLKTTSFTSRTFMVPLDLRFNENIISWKFGIQLECLRSNLEKETV